MLHGILDVMVLQTLDVMGPQHGYGIARRIEQMMTDGGSLNQGTIYASLVRLQQRGWIESEWGVSDNNRRAKFYAITSAGSKHLTASVEDWKQTADLMDRVLDLSAGTQ